MSKMKQLEEAIAAMEGFSKPNSVAHRCNNPGNLIFAKQRFAMPYVVKGRDGKIRTYAKFPDPETGWLAMERQLLLYARRGLSLREAIHKWAPASDDNNPKGYLAFVAKRIGVSDCDRKLQEILQEED